MCKWSPWGGPLVILAPPELCTFFRTQVMKGKFTKYFELSAKLGGEVATHVRIPV